MSTPHKPNLKIVSEGPLNAETLLKGHEGTFTPNESFFKRNRTEIPALSTDTWSLRVCGEVNTPATYTYQELLRMPRNTVDVTLECAGNGRSDIEPHVRGEAWGHGAVSTARWEGVSLSRLLRDCGVKYSAIEVLFEGADGDHEIDGGKTANFARSLKLDKAMDSDVLLAYRMNGDELPVEHGYPLRLVVPGYYGMASVKWLVKIELIPYEYSGFYQSARYVIRVPGQKDTPVTNIGVRSVITNIENGQKVPAGMKIISGKAWSGTGKIVKVEISEDCGKSWKEAALQETYREYAWCNWTCMVNLHEIGNAVIMSRAFDESGNEQPMDPVWNEFGYANNSVQRVSIVVE